LEQTPYNICTHNPQSECNSCSSTTMPIEGIGWSDWSGQAFSEQ
jgi:hypothetical protein